MIKLDPRARKCIFLDHKTGTKGYLLFDLHNREIFLSRNVVFYEKLFPYKTNEPYDSLTNEGTENELGFLDLVPQPTIGLLDNVGDGTYETHIENAPLDNPTNGQAINSHHTHGQRKSEHIRHPPNYLQDFYSNMMNTKGTKIQYPIYVVLSYQSLSTDHLSHLISITTTIKPKHYNQAIKFSHWIEAIQNELNALELYKTWTVVNLPPNKQAI
ncbi:PREDICTED: uncharacterized protein LOC109359913 [Lupinus angustifolius]|uniref:uncharacterized protein LOC109359913 n=1 Tax=Lupinus angustifolius TaxID=3871 RepID=UPI00092F0344|nr:PREDICTED: uncharacterized protein LOC109359913 [Lupinus angustifolius]